MRKRIEKESQMVLRLSQKDNETLVVKVFETHFEKLDEDQKHLELRGIINEYDPVFLLWFAYEDEYDGEIETINEDLHTSVDKTEVYELVHYVFKKRFNISWEDDIGWMGRQDYINMAKDIFNWLNYGLS